MRPRGRFVASGEITYIYTNTQLEPNARQRDSRASTWLDGVFFGGQGTRASMVLTLHVHKSRHRISQGIALRVVACVCLRWSVWTIKKHTYRHRVVPCGVFLEECEWRFYWLHWPNFPRCARIRAHLHGAPPKQFGTNKNAKFFAGLFFVFVFFSVHNALSNRIGRFS